MTKKNEANHQVYVENKEEKKMPWQETMTKLEAKVKEAQEKEEALNAVTAEFNVAKDEYAKALDEMNALREEMSNMIGNLFPQTNSRVKVSN